MARLKNSFLITFSKHSNIESRWTISSFDAQRGATYLTKKVFRLVHRRWKPALWSLKVGFISRSDTEQRLKDFQSLPNETAIIRFSDSWLGAISVARSDMNAMPQVTHHQVLRIRELVEDSLYQVRIISSQNYLSQIQRIQRAARITYIAKTEEYAMKNQMSLDFGVNHTKQIPLEGTTSVRVSFLHGFSRAQNCFICGQKLDKFFHSMVYTLLQTHKMWSRSMVHLMMKTFKSEFPRSWYVRKLSAVSQCK